MTVGQVISLINSKNRQLSSQKRSPCIELLCTSASPTSLRPYPSRQLCADRKGPFDHFRARPMVINTIRIGLSTSSTIFARYLTDQLEAETNRLQDVRNGSLSVKQARKENEEWEKNEWEARWKELPTKVCHAFLKFHSVTLCMRFYEYVASKVVTDETLDKLTTDTFRAAKREPNRSFSEHLETNLWANAISFLADCTIYQVLMMYSYYIYYEVKKKKRLNQLLLHCNNDITPHDENSGGIALSIILKSTKLSVSRSIALVTASAGGAVGTMILPGWGTLFGTHMVDSLVSTLTE